MIRLLAFNSNAENYSFNSDLDGGNYRFDVNWNQRDEAWYFSLFDEDGEAIFQGAKILVGNGALINNTKLNRPPGELVVVSLDQSDRKPSRTELGVRVVVLYSEAA